MYLEIGVLAAATVCNLGTGETRGGSVKVLLNKTFEIEAGDEELLTRVVRVRTGNGVLMGVFVCVWRGANYFHTLPMTKLYN